ncbi:tetratricopeptide repeat protein [Paraburkholderia nemoris]|uniref:tetratricopeptide repeat-containing glycosyltransferase family protein n=1 Tax=Paraburkholderia nemoris TaxID=2793076 RepID=UPI001B08BEF7|nr:tetratricopeptide repeat-containing glycosyltransferase family protein [Paraburkholderia nemoris]CAE6776793.1 Photosystem I assembly protein Ycf3 [Paraburkholderia nemoris]
MEHQSHPTTAPPSAYLTSLIEAALEAHQAGRLDAAEPFYREALALDPTHAKTLHYFGVLQHQRGNHAFAAELMSEALKLDRTDAACWSNRGLVAVALGHREEAMICYDQALQLQPDFADARNNFGVALQAQGSLEVAIEQYRLALAANPELVDAHLNLGTALNKLGRYDEALACYQNALTLDPQSAEAHFNAGNAYNAQGDHAAAIASFERAQALRGDYAEAHINLDSLIGKLGDYVGAESQYRRAVALKPNPTNLVCLGGSLGAQGRLDDEEGFYRHALALDSNCADAHQNLAWLLLKRGDYKQGWAEFAQRWRKSDYEAIAVPGVAEWHGEPLDERRLLLVGEQGFGDHFQFLRYARVLEQLGATVDLCVREPLLPLVERIPGVHRAFSGKPEGPYDFWVPMMSVPSCVSTELSTIPADVPYIFAEKAKIKTWRKRVDAAGKAKRKVGLVWSGSPTFGNDRYRSMVLTNLSPLSELNDIAWYALQKGPAHDQLADAPEAFRAHDFTADLKSFDDTAALIMNLDLVIAVDTGVAHLAAALGKPVWVLLPANSDWRWLEERSDSPWYPAMKLFRQTRLGDWAPVVKRVSEELRDGSL